MKTDWRHIALAAALAAASACSSRGNLSLGSGQSSGGANADFAIAYIKRALPANAAGLAQLRAKDDVTLPRRFASSADVYVRNSATPTGI